MKKLFLCSYFSKVFQLLLPLLPAVPNKLTVAFIPTAADPYNDAPWKYEGKNTLLEMGFHVTEVDLKNKTKAQLSKELSDKDIVYVSGGNTYYLLEKVRQSGFDEIIKELLPKGIIYIGSSAGVVLACPTIDFIEDLDDKSKASLTSFEGLGLVDFLILPHDGEQEYEERHRAILKKWDKKKYEVKTLTNNQAIVVDGHDITVF